MTGRTPFLSRCIALTILCATTAAAQAADANRRQGFWFSGGLGAASFGCSDCGDRANGLGVHLSLGGTVSPRLLVGAGSDSFTKSEDGVTGTFATLDARVRFYPTLTNGFFLTGGLGVGSARASGDGVSVTSNGGSGIVGVGYDIPIGKRASLTPYLNVFSLRIEGTTSNVASLGVAITLP